MTTTRKLSKSASQKWNEQNRDKCNEAQRKYRSKNTEKARAATRKSRWKKYGVTPEQVEALFTAQGKACAVCGRDKPTGRGWHVDHCHKTGKVRGILCQHCNTGLGCFLDNPDTLISASSYLKQFIEGVDERTVRDRADA